MKSFNKGSNVLLIVLALALVGLIIFLMVKGLGDTGQAGKSQAALAISADLSSAVDFSVLAGLSIAANGTGTTISGDLGLSPGLAVSRTGTWTIGGSEFFGTGGASANAQADALTAFNSLANQIPDGLWASASPTPGVYNILSDTTFAGPTLTLSGDYDDVWVFQIGQDMTFTGNVVMAGTAQACNVFWQIGRDATIAAGSQFAGTIIASRDITVASGATVNGRIISLNSSLVFESGNTVSGPTCATPPAPTTATLNVIKHVITNNGGTATAANWNLAVSSSNSGSGTGSATGTEIGTIYTLEAGKQYSVTESGGPSGYLMTGSANCTIPSAVAGTDYVCTITNDDIAPQLIVNKIVVNDNGGTKVIADFPLFVDGNSVTSGVVSTTTIGLHTISETADSGYTSTIGGNCAANGTITLALGDVKTCTITNDDIAPIPSPSGGGNISLYTSPVPPLIDVVKTPSPLVLPAGPGSVTYTYTLRNIGTVPVNNIKLVGDTCSPITLVSGDNNRDSILALNEIWTYNCFTTLTKTHTNIVTAIGWANGISATDIAKATVIVGLPIVPPLINVTKVPNPLVLSALGGMVTYTNKVTNPGMVALSNVRLTDDKCRSVKYISGDTNSNSKLDITEIWTYTCSTKLTKTTVNTVTASGDANGLTAKDFAIVTVIVNAAVPKLPNTGFPPRNEK